MIDTGVTCNLYINFTKSASTCGYGVIVFARSMNDVSISQLALRIRHSEKPVGVERRLETKRAFKQLLRGECVQVHLYSWGF